MKDDKLEKEFEGYFKGVNTPENITGDAKKHVKPKDKFLPKFVKFASIAASFVLVFAVALTLILKPDFDKNSPSDGNTSIGGNNPSDGEEFLFYTDADLDTEEKNAYSIASLDGSLKFIENLAFAGNASVETCKVGYRDGKLALVKAEASVMLGLNRDDTKIYVEFTESRTVYGELADYFGGTKLNYGGLQYYLTEGVAENGEPEFLLHLNYGGVKYYFSVTSSDKKAYEKYLKIIFK